VSHNLPTYTCKNHDLKSHFLCRGNSFCMHLLFWIPLKICWYRKIQLLLRVNELLNYDLIACGITLMSWEVAIYRLVTISNTLVHHSQPFFRVCFKALCHYKFTYYTKFVEWGSKKSTKQRITKSAKIGAPTLIRRLLQLLYLWTNFELWNGVHYCICPLNANNFALQSRSQNLEALKSTWASWTSEESNKLSG